MLNKWTCLTTSATIPFGGPSSLIRVNPKFPNFQFLGSAVTGVGSVIGVMTLPCPSGIDVRSTVPVHMYMDLCRAAPVRPPYRSLPGASGVQSIHDFLARPYFLLRPARKCREISRISHISYLISHISSLSAISRDLGYPNPVSSICTVPSCPGILQQARTGHSMTTG